MIEQVTLPFLITEALLLFVFWALIFRCQTPVASVVVHGGTALVAIFLLLCLSNYAETSVATELLLFGIAALSGLALYAIDQNKKQMTPMLSVLHPTIGAFSLAILLGFSLQVL